jgi:hypothetical protein
MMSSNKKYESLSTNNVLSMFVTHENITKTTYKMQVSESVINKSKNLALKAK